MLSINITEKLMKKRNSTTTTTTIEPSLKILSNVRG